MRLNEILEIIRSNLLLGILGVLVVLIIFVLGYFIIYKKLLGGRKNISGKRLILGGIFIIYIIMVLGVTFLNREPIFKGEASLHFLSTYREAWNNGTLRSWQMEIFNIVMFMPLGFLLPLIYEKFQNIGWTFLAGLIFTLFIEITQFITGLGIFVLDDIFNNLLGAVLGYSIIMSILTLVKGKGFKNLFKYLSPLLLVILVFSGIYIAYEKQEFGNLDINYDYRINMKNVELINNLDLKNSSKGAFIYKGPKYDKKSAREFVVKTFKNIDVDIKDLDIKEYHNNGMYNNRGEPGYIIWLNYLDGSYTYTDFSQHYKGMKVLNVEKEKVIEELKKFNIDIPKEAKYTKGENGDYIWTAEKIKSGNTLVDGVLICQYYNDNSIKNIDNNLVKYTKVKEVPIISEEQALNRIKEGKFKFFIKDGIYKNSINKIEKIELIDLKLDYYLDSKGYYQPVYVFNALVDEIENNIIIPAIL